MASSTETRDARRLHPGAQRVFSVSAPSKTITTAGSRALSLACEAAKEVLRGDFGAFVRSHSEMPIMTSKSCDGTPMNTKHRTRATLPSGAVVRRSGRASHEFLVKLQFGRVLEVDGAKTCVVMEEATPLEHGKAVPAIAAACLRDWVTLREA
eukprot:687343-Lingulodinium_polyedra.AAC.1